MDSDNHRIRELTPPDYSEEEQERIIQYFMSLKKDLIKKFLQENEISISGTRQALRDRVLEHLDNESIEYKDLVNYLDTLTPWGKQHIFIYDGPESEIQNWRNEEFVGDLLEENDLSEYLNSRLPLILPEGLALSSIEYQPNDELVIYAVERREYRERITELDETKTIGDREIELRAYSRQVARGVIVFRWNLISNTAILQISQLPTGSRYEEVEEKFSNLVSQLFNLEIFQKIDLKPVINKLHELADRGNPEARPHDIEYRSPGGRRISVASPTQQDSISGEQLVDNGIRPIRRQGIGHFGNFYWLPASVNPIECLRN